MKPVVLIPIYDHGSTIERVMDALAPLGLPGLIVDDGSGPATVQALERVAQRHPWTRIVRHDQNRGRGAALATGYRASLDAGHTHALQLDADGQHDPADAPRMLAAAAVRPHALILGAPQFGADAPRARRWGRMLSRVCVWIETCSFEVTDPLCGYRCIPLAEVVRLLDRSCCGEHMEFDPEIAVRLVWAGVPIVNVPTPVRYFSGGLSHFDMWRDNVRITWLHTRLLTGMLPRAPALIARSLRRVA